MSHAVLSASGADRWLHCPASAGLEKDIPEKKSEHAALGTVAHHLAALCLNEDKEPVDFMGQTLKDGDAEGVVDYEMAEAVERYLIYVRGLGGKPFVEQRVDFSHIVPKGFGTSDFVVEVQEEEMKEDGTDILFKNVLYVVDYKHGKGVEVSAKNNPQGLLYALGTLHTLDFAIENEIDLVKIVIFQPRINNFSEFSITPKDLYKWAESIKTTAGRAFELYQDPDKVEEKDFGPTEKGCKFCKLKQNGSCKALANHGYNTALEGFEDLTKEVKPEAFKKVNELSNADLGKLYGEMSFFVSWYEDLKQTVLDKLMDGEEVPGFKPVRGNGSRKWKHDKDATIKHLRTAGLKKEDYEKVSLITAPQAEAALKKVKKPDWKKRFEKLEQFAIKKIEGGPVIAKTDDRRDSIAPSIDDFEDVSKKPELSEDDFTKGVDLDKQKQNTKNLKPKEK